MNDRAGEWIASWLDGSLTESEERNLFAWIGENPENLQRFTEANVRDQQLREAVHAALAVESAEKQSNVSPMPSFRWTKIVTPLAAAATVAVLGFLWLNRPDAGSVRAVIVSSDDARITGKETPLVDGDELALDRFQLESGSLEIELTSGVTVEFLAPVDAEFQSDMRLRLFDGRVNADVGARGKGFTVVTDAGEVIDLGTRFGVEADRGGESRVAVFSGSVEVHPRDAAESEAPITLTEGQAARFSVLAGLRRWEQVALAAKAAGLASKDYGGIVSRVRDNRGDKELHPFYGIVRSGFQRSALAFTDKPNPRWAPREHDAIPGWLEGADLIRTYHQFRMKKDYELTLTLREPATVYVLIKAEQSMPAWLTENFTDTGAKVPAGPFMQGSAGWPGARLDENGLPHFQFSIWKANAPAGDFSLGSARSADKGGKRLMYGLAVKPRNDKSS